MDSNVKALLKMVYEEPASRLCEYQKALHDRYGVELAISTLSEFFSKHEINRLKVFLEGILLITSFKKKQWNVIQYFVLHGL